MQVAVKSEFPAPSAVTINKEQWASVVHSGMVLKERIGKLVSLYGSHEDLLEVYEQAIEMSELLESASGAADVRTSGFMPPLRRRSKIETETMRKRRRNTQEMVFFAGNTPLSPAQAMSLVTPATSPTSSMASAVSTAMAASFAAGSLVASPPASSPASGRVTPDAAQQPNNDAVLVDSHPSPPHASIGGVVSGLLSLAAMAERSALETRSDSSSGDEVAPRMMSYARPEPVAATPMSAFTRFQLKPEPSEPRRAAKPRMRSRTLSTADLYCHSCGETSSCEWRRGPDGTKSLCNACGIHFAKIVKREEKSMANYRPKEVSLNMLLNG